MEQGKESCPCACTEPESHFKGAHEDGIEEERPSQKDSEAISVALCAPSAVRGCSDPGGT